MASIRKRFDAYQVMVRKHGAPPLSKTFRRLSDAKAWARKVECEIERGSFLDTAEAQTTLLGHVLKRYREEILPQNGRGGPNTTDSEVSTRRWVTRPSLNSSPTMSTACG